MNEETNQILKEIRDLQRESIENQKKSLEYVKTTQKVAMKKLIIAFVVIFFLVLFINLIK